MTQVCILYIIVSLLSRNTMLLALRDDTETAEKETTIYSLLFSSYNLEDHVISQTEIQCIIYYRNPLIRLFTVPYFLVRSLRYSASFNDSHLGFQMYRRGRASGIIALAGGGREK